jgi:hypothetical protein
METRQASLESQLLLGQDTGSLEHHARPHEAFSIVRDDRVHRNQVKAFHEVQHRGCHYIVAPMVLAGRSPR